MLGFETAPQDGFSCGAASSYLLSSGLSANTKTVDTTEQQSFLRCAAPLPLEIREYSCGKMTCPAQKIHAVDSVPCFRICLTVGYGVSPYQALLRFADFTAGQGFHLAPKMLN